MRTTLYAQISPDAKFEDRRALLTYKVPAKLNSDVQAGQLVWIPLRRQIVLGVVVELTEDPPAGDYEVREIQAIVEPAFALSSIQWQLATWIAESTICSLFEAASLMFPPGVESRAVENLALVQRPDDDKSLTRLQRQLVELLEDRGEVTIAAARRALDSKLTTVIPALEDAGIIRKVIRVQHRDPADTTQYQVRIPPDAEEPPERAPKQLDTFTALSRRLRARPDGAMLVEELVEAGLATRPILRALEKRGSIVIEPVVPTQMPPDNIAGHTSGVRLTEEQYAALQRILEAQKAGDGGQVLLQGVTGSGKTEVYFRAIAETLAKGKSALLLVPEISLAGQMIVRARDRFGDQALVIHSSLTDRLRHETWERATDGNPWLIVGPRSALFAPVADLGLIVLDEEHDAAYKQDQIPRYHGRAVAERLGELHRATVVFGSATPDVETRFRSGNHGWKRLQLSERIGQSAIDDFGEVRAIPIPLPSVSIVDMRAELRAGHASLFSRRLESLLERRIRRGEQSILFLNRRGTSTMVQCRECGTVSECPLCDIPLVYHRQAGRIICHRCGHRSLPPKTCPECGNESFGYYGAGTQRVEREIREQFPGARVMRWDQDALRGGVDHGVLLGRVERGEVDIIVGTQMVSKGLDLPNVTLVGVVNADTYIHLPDFRAAERTFQMLAQVSGRAGRRSAGGEVIIQTFSPDHYAIKSTETHDYDNFYQQEIEFRRRHGYPPFKRLVRLLYRHSDEDEARFEAERLAEQVEEFLYNHPEYAGIDLLGPAPAFSARVRGQYGWQLLVRGDLGAQMLAELPIPFGWVVDVDPLDML